MPRKLRIHIPGALYHVILRGNARQDIFSDDRDRLRFYEILNKSHERFQYRILAFCLMINHVHLAVQVGDIPLSRIMQNISQNYTRWFNWRHTKCGHVFQGRYKAIMVDADSYLLELVAYIHLNPVRAGVADQPAQHRWSSHRAYLGEESIPWLEPDPVLSQFADKIGNARRMFFAFVEERRGSGRRAEFHGEKTLDNRLFGGDRFTEDILSQVETPAVHRPDVGRIVVAVTELYGIDLDHLAAPGQERTASEARGLAAWATRELSCGTLGELAQILKRNPSTLSCAVRRLEIRLENDPALVEKREQLRAALQQVQFFKV